jgi:prolyl-tRNA synthetase
MAEDVYARLTASGVDALLDDRDERAGAKFATMELIGLPWQVTVGPRGVKAGTVELKYRRTGETVELGVDALIQRLVG